MFEIGGGIIRDLKLDFITVENRLNDSIFLHKQIEQKDGRLYFRIKKRILKNPFLKNPFEGI